MTEKTRFHDGLERQVSLFGLGMRKQQTDAPELRSNVNRWLADNCFGDYYTRNGLNDREREMITFYFILAQGGCEISFEVIQLEISWQEMISQSFIAL